MKVEVEIKACNFVKELPIKGRRIILKQLRRLEEPFLVSEIEKIGHDVYPSAYWSDLYCILYDLYGTKSCQSDRCFSIETTHKQYNRFA